MCNQNARNGYFEMIHRQSYTSLIQLFVESDLVILFKSLYVGICNGSNSFQLFWSGDDCVLAIFIFYTACPNLTYADSDTEHVYV